MLFVAITSTGPFDIGDFATVDDARDWSESRFGGDLIEVVPQLTTAVNVTTTPPMSPLLIAALAIGAVVLLWGGGTQGGSEHVEI